MYVNPLAGQPEPGSGFVKNDVNVSTITGLGLYSTGAFRIDELRVGQTFTDVTPAQTRPVPEGGAGWVVVVTLAGMALAARRCRVRQSPCA